MDVPIGSTGPNGYSADRPDSATSKSVPVGRCPCVNRAIFTPISKSRFKKQSNTIDSDLDIIINEEAPHAPNQQRVARSRLDGVQLSSVAVALFQRELAAEM
ncbi:hypothetical protein B296_00046739 [Ensete ventricosum]|uniref:Uncharacterized protein n=1 Tax=Ensete ventricosum TaxID=4639 RepID=A0A426XHJ7_ENSVE|nr:hypothetical protein B296_00046739 [Ensete ventricosum]